MELVTNRQPLINFKFKHQAFVYSLVIHSLLVVIIIKNAPKIQQKQNIVHQIIEAKLYSTPITLPKTEVTATQEKNQQNLTTENSPPLSNNEQNQNSQKVLKPTKVQQHAPKKIASKQALLNSIKPISPKTSHNTANAFSSLEKLAQQVSNQAMNESAVDSYQQYMADKQTIAKSTTKYGQIIEAKPKKVAVNCDNTLNKGLTILSGLLGGSIKCNSFNGSQKYIDDRLERMGKKPKKND